MNPQNPPNWTPAGPTAPPQQQGWPPHQGMPQPGMPQPGMPQPGMPQPGMAQPGMHPGMGQPGVQQPGMPQQPWPPQGAPQQPMTPPAPMPQQAPPQQMQPPQLPQQQMAGGAGPAWVAKAMRRPPFTRLVRAEFRKFSGTLSDRILLVVGPVVLIGFSVLLAIVAGFSGTWSGQISPLLSTLIYGPLALNAALVKLIAGEWQYRSAQPALLVQPSRLRYMLAQSTVALFVWIFTAVVATGLYSLLAPSSIQNGDQQSLLALRPGLLIASGIVAALVAVLWALVIALLVPNAAGALAIYLISVPVLIVVQGLLPTVLSWIDPFRIPMAVAATDAALASASTYTAAAVLVALLVVATLLYRRREAA